MAELRRKEIFASLIFHGSCNTELFVKWFTKHLVPNLKSGQIVVMNNATFHKSNKLKEAVEVIGYQLICLPPYSPNLNPIEKFCANMKKWIKHNFYYLEIYSESISDSVFTLYYIT